MKKFLKISIVSLAAFGFAGCDDFLDTYPEGNLAVQNFYRSYEECRGGTASLYNAPWFTFSNQYFFHLGDMRANNLFDPWDSGGASFVRMTETAETGLIQNGWAGLYNVVTQADYLVNYLDNALSNGVSEKQVNACKGEARFMRGLAYWYLMSTWGAVPIVEDPMVAATNYSMFPNTQEDVLQYAIRDLEFAAQWLPETDNPGRVTRYSALGALARLYITAACYARGNNFSSKWPTTAAQYYELARLAAKEVCETETYSLMSDYEELFRVQNNNNSESLFALQFTPGVESYGVGNRNQEYLAYSAVLTGGLNAWGNAKFCGGDLVELMHSRGELKRKKGTFFYYQARYDYLGNSEKNTWTDGYWIVDNDVIPSSLPQYCAPKKMIVGSSEDSGGVAINGNSGLATPMLRLAEVYLLYAEAILGMNASTTDAEAIKYFKKVRDRAGLTDAVDQITLQDIWDERRCELALEGLFWYDMVRRSYWDMNWMLNYINNQKRCHLYYYLKSPYGTTTYPQGIFWRVKEDGSPETDGFVVVTATADRMKLPYPANEVSKDPNLRGTPVPFDFE